MPYVFSLYMALHHHMVYVLLYLLFIFSHPFSSCFLHTVSTSNFILKLRPTNKVQIQRHILFFLIYVIDLICYNPTWSIISMHYFWMVSFLKVKKIFSVFFQLDILKNSLRIQLCALDKLRIYESVSGHLFCRCHHWKTFLWINFKGVFYWKTVCLSISFKTLISTESTFIFKVCW